MKTALIYITLFMLLISCQPKIITVPQTKIEYINNIQKDSIYYHDSIYLKETNYNDTTRIYEYHYNYIYQDKVRVDSIIMIDSIPYPVEIYIDKIVYKRSLQDTIQIWQLYLLIPMLGVIYLLRRFKLI